MYNLDCCPFCGCDEVIIETETHRLGVSAQIFCNHCGARGGHFVETEEEEAIERVVRDWNQKSLRPYTLCDRVKRFFVQLRYDLATCWGRF